MSRYEHSDLLDKLSAPTDNSQSHQLSTITHRHSNGFVSITSIFALLVALLLLICIGILTSQMWQNAVSSSVNAEKILVSKEYIVSNVQQQNALQLLQKNAVTSTASAIDGSNGDAVEPQVITEQISEKQSEKSTEIIKTGGKEPQIQKFTGDPAIYNESISGRVLTGSGNILSGINVTANRLPQQGGVDEPPANGAGYSVNTQDIRSNQNGEFVFKYLKPGLYRISARRQDSDIRSSMIVKSGMNAVDLVLPIKLPAEIAGQVTDEYGMPLEGVSVKLVPGKVQVQSDRHGEFLLADSLSGDLDYEIQFDHPDYEPAFLRLSGASLIGTGREVPVSARMRAITGVTTITGRITDVNGNLLAGQRVRLLSPETNFRELVLTDQYGEFRFEQVIAGSDYRLGVSPDKSYLPWIKRDIEITPASRYFELVLEPLSETGTIEGRIVDTSGNPVPNFSLTINANSAGEYRISVHSDDNGKFIAQNVPAGAVTLRTAAEPDLLLTNLALDPGATKHVIVPVDWGKQELTGRLVDPYGEPVAGAKITLSWSQRQGRTLSQTRRQSRTDKSGRFRFSNLGAGAHFLTVTGSQIEPVSKQVNVGVDSAKQHIVIQRLAI